MRRVVAWIVDGLPLDAHSRRVLDETLLDWAHEEAKAATKLARSLVGPRAVASVARALALAVGRESAVTPYGRLLIRSAVVSAVPAAIYLTLFYRWLAELRSSAAPFVGVELSALLVPHEVEILLPLVFFLAVFSSPARRIPAIGAGLAAGAAALAVNLLIAPAANTAFFDLANVYWMPTHPNSTYSPTGWTLREVGVAFVGVAILGGLAFKLSLAALAGALAVFACVLRPRIRRRRILIWLAAPVLYLGTLELVAAGHLPVHYALTESILGAMCLTAVAVMRVATVGRVVLRRPWMALVLLAVVGAAIGLLPDDWLYVYRVLGSSLAPAVLALVVAFSAAHLIRTARSARVPETIAEGVIA